MRDYPATSWRGPYPRARDRSSETPEMGIGEPIFCVGSAVWPRHDRLRSSLQMDATVLIVDDDPAFRVLARRMIEDAGLTVTGEAADGGSALAEAAAARPDAILVDVSLPDRDGYDLCRELARLPWRPRLLLTSSDSDAGDANGAVPFVAKQDLANAPLRELLAANPG